MIHDRDPRFTVAFRETLAAADVQAVVLPPRSPNLNAYAERFVRSIKESCLDRIILVGEASLRRAVREFADHYHHERNHQGLDNRLIVPLAEQANHDGEHCVSRATRWLVELLSPTCRLKAVDRPPKTPVRVRVSHATPTTPLVRSGSSSYHELRHTSFGWSLFEAKNGVCRSMPDRLRRF